MSVTRLTRSDPTLFYPGTSIARSSGYRNGWKQSPITPKPLAYTGTFLIDQGFSGSHRATSSATNLIARRDAFLNLGSQFGNQGTKALNKAILSLNDKLGLDGELGTTLAEFTKSGEMLRTRAIRLGNALAALTRGRFRDFLRHLNVPPKFKHRNKTHATLNSVQGLWLEYWFGWSALVGDINTSVEILQSPLPQDLRIFGGSKYELSETLEAGVPTPKPWEGYTYDRMTATAFAKVGATFSIENPLLYRANALGFNPVSIGYNLLPWSWFLDWFIPIGNFLRAHTMSYAGISHRDWYYTLYFNGKTVRRNVTWVSYLNKHESFNASNGVVGQTRYVGRPQYALVPNNFQLSLTRAATAIDLLLGRLKGTTRS